MTDEPLAPTGRSVHYLPDTHIGGSPVRRIETVTEDLATGYEDQAPAIRFMVGDFGARCHHSQIVYALSWMDDMPPALDPDLILANGTTYDDSDPTTPISWTPPNPYAVIAGNHDWFETNPDPDPVASNWGNDEIPADWVGLVGPYSFAIDLGWVKVVGLGFPTDESHGSDPDYQNRLVQDQMDYLDAEAQASGGQPVWLSMHGPLFETVGGRAVGRQRVYSSWTTHFQKGPGSDTSEPILEVLEANPNIELVTSGHTHSPQDVWSGRGERDTAVPPTMTPGPFADIAGLGHTCLHLNTGGIIHNHPGFVRRNAPIRTPYVERRADSIAVFWRDHRWQVWTGPQAFKSERVKVLPVDIELDD